MTRNKKSLSLLRNACLCIGVALLPVHAQANILEEKDAVQLQDSELDFQGKFRQIVAGYSGAHKTQDQMDCILHVENTINTMLEVLYYTRELVTVSAQMKDKDDEAAANKELLNVLERSIAYTSTESTSIQAIPKNCPQDEYLFQKAKETEDIINRSNVTLTTIYGKIPGHKTRVGMPAGPKQ